MLKTNTFTASEAAVLLDLPEKQVRKEIEYKVIEVGAPPRLDLPALLYLHLVRKSSLVLRVQDRASLYQRIVEVTQSGEWPEEIEVVEPFFLRLNDNTKQLKSKLSRFADWRESLTSDPDVMGGSVVFPGTRLTVQHIGGMMTRNIDAEEIKEDYPYLSDEDLEFAKLYIQAHPQRGRPSAA